MASTAVVARRQRFAWTPDPGALAQAQAATWHGDPQGDITEQQPIGTGVVEFGRYVRANFPLVYQTYARGRDMASVANPSMHHAGRAIDLMMHEVGGGPNRDGDALANWILANARDLGVQYMIWSGVQWSSATGRTSIYPGTEDHTNHIHVDFSVAGAAGQTPWFHRAEGGGSVVGVLAAAAAAAAALWWLRKT